MNKHGNKISEYNGIKFSSQREMRRFIELDRMQLAGIIINLRRQVSFELVPSVMLDNRKKPAIRYVADFTYCDEKGMPVVEDAKSPHLRSDAVYRMKKHMMKWKHGIDIVEV